MKEFTENQLLLLAYLEGDLEPNEREAFEMMLEDDKALMAEYKLLQKTKLQPPPITYSGKASLKRAVVVPIKKEKVILSYLLWPSAIAAGLAILLLLYVPQKQTGSGVVAKVETTPKIENKMPAQSATGASVEAEIKEETTQPAITKRVITTPVINPENTASLNEEVEKNTIENPALLNAIAYTGPALQKGKVQEIRIHAIPQNTLELEVPEKESWLAKAKNKGVVLLSNIQMPRLKINKAKGQEPYWALTVETDKYEMQAKLFSSK